MNAAGPEDLGALLSAAVARINAGALAEAGALLDRALAAAPQNMVAVYLSGMVALLEQRPAEAEAHFLRVLASGDGPPQLYAMLAQAQRALGKNREALTAYGNALAVQPNDPQLQFEAATLMHALDHWNEAEAAYRAALTLAPGWAAALAGLGNILTLQGRHKHAEDLLRAAVRAETEPQGLSLLEAALSGELKAQGRFGEALNLLDRARKIAGAPAMDHQRAVLLQHLGRHDEAIAHYRAMLEREPLDMEAHLQLNEMLYRLKRDGDFLASYDAAEQKRPDAPALPVKKGHDLMQNGRVAEAEEAFARALRIAPDDHAALSGLAAAQFAQGRAAAALDTHARNLALHPATPSVMIDYANALLRSDEAARALALMEEAARIAPDNQAVHALTSLCYRALKDGREERLNGYDSLVRAFDLEPPEGFADMDAFNRELAAYLDGLHTDERDYYTQTSRGGTRAFDELFGNGHGLVERLRTRITEALGRHIAALPADAAHPVLRRRRGRDFSYTSSWSTRLVDCGFHVNHIHQGWLSCCYYVAVPDAVRDTEQKQGWIKFGEAPEEFGDAFSMRHAIQPAPGRLAVFPSYTWHGTIPFRSAAPRTTIAFDIVPR